MAQILRLLIVYHCSLVVTLFTWITWCGNKTKSEQVALGQVCAALCKLRVELGAVKVTNTKELRLSETA